MPAKLQSIFKKYYHAYSLYHFQRCLGSCGVLCIARNHTPFIYHPNTFDTCCKRYALQRRCACAIQSRKCVSIFIVECSFQRFAHCFLFVVMKYLLVLFTVWFIFLLAIDFWNSNSFFTKGLSIGQAVSIGRTLFHKLLWLEFISCFRAI